MIPAQRHVAARLVTIALLLWLASVPAAAAAATVIRAPARAPAPPQATPTPAPAPASPAPDARSGGADPFAALGARSPFCDRAVGGHALRNCRVSGSIAHRYPLLDYGLDNQVAMSVTGVQNNLLGALQDFAAFVWLALVFVMKGVLLLLEWAFSLDLLNQAMSAVRAGLDGLHRGVLGAPWFLAAICIAGCWGIWRGLVQRRTIQTLSGLASTVVLMLAALVVISDPAGTVGQASQLADNGSLSVVAGTVGGSVSTPAPSFANALEGVFDSAVVRPWAALEFGDVGWALSPARPGSPLTNADIWLSFPAGSRERQDLYKLQKGESLGGTPFFRIGQLALTAINGGLAATLGLAPGVRELQQPDTARLSDALRAYVHKDPSKVTLQEASGTFPRLALLALVAIGLIGAILLFLYVGVRLLLASVMSLLLVLIAPVMLLVPAFGDSGRATTMAWGRRLAGALAAKLVYSLLLAVLLVASAAIEALQIGWFGTWLVLIAFWWGVLIKRRELVGYISIRREPPGRTPPAGGSMRAYYALRRLAPRSRRRGAGLALPRPGKLPIPPGAADVAGFTAVAFQQHALRADRAFNDEVAASRGRLAERADLLDQLARTGAEAPAQGEPSTPGRSVSSPAEPAPSRDLLLERIRGTEAPQVPPANAPNAEAAYDAPLDGRLREFMRRRSAEIARAGADPADPVHLLSAGIDPSVYGDASEEGRKELQRQAGRMIARDRQDIRIVESGEALRDTPSLLAERDAPNPPPPAREPSVDDPQRR